MPVTVTTLIENAQPEHKHLLHEHGLSFHVRTAETTFLFDCGPGDSFLRNARSLNIDLHGIDFVVCSHAHYDHCGGLKPLLAEIGPKPLYTGENFFLPKYARDGIRHTFLGVDFDAAYLRQNGIRHETVADIRRIDDSCWLIGGFRRDKQDNPIPERYALLDGGVFVPDRFNDEICLAVRFEDGVAVLVGCSHPGVVNMLETVRERLDLPVRGVWGGTHLAQCGADAIESTVAALKRMGVRHFGLSHCSGDAILEHIRADAEITGCRLRTGDGVSLFGAAAD